MPILHLEGNEQDLVWVVAVMLFPKDPARRSQFMAVSGVNSKIKRMRDHESLLVDVATIKLLLDSPSWEGMEEIVVAARKNATYAGYILEMIYLMDRFKDRCDSFKRPSMSKAIAMCRQFSLTNKFGDGRPMHYSPKKIRDCWDEYKSVAHLWAAFEVNRSYPFSDDGKVFASLSALNEFLEVAQGMLEFGTQFRLEGSKPPLVPLPLLTVEEMWIAPSIVPRYLKSDRVPDKLLKFIDGYRA